MSDAKRLDRWLQQAADSPAMRDLLARADAQPDLPEEVLADYYAGELSPAEQQLVEKRIAASESMGRFLAAMDADVNEALPAPPPRPAVSTAWSRAVALLDKLLPAPSALRLASGLAAVVLVVGVTSRVLDRPPTVGPEYGTSSTLRGPAGLATLDLPGGPVALVDLEWPLRAPLDTVSRVRWFAWDPARGAATYALELRDAAGNAVFTAPALRRSVVRLPWSTRRALRRGEVYLWIVTAMDETGAPQRRGIGRFRIE